MQVIKLEVPIQVPEHLIVVEKKVFQELTKKEMQGQWWTLDDVLKHINISRKTFTEKILNNHKYRKQLESFVHYPQNKGGKYYFLASKTKEFLEINFKTITTEITGGKHD